MQKNNYEIKDLKWDTEMFEKKSAKIILNNEISKDILKEIETNISEHKYKFITIENKGNNEKNNIVLRDLNNIFLADVNVQFKKILNPEENIGENINIVIRNKLQKNENILKIARESFIHSRFVVDDNLNKNKYRVYEEWTKNSFDKEDKYFCIYSDDKKIKGYILFSIETNNIFLELIAIDKQAQNLGIGTQLIKELEKFAVENKILSIKVGTQINNLKAQNFYEKNGFLHVENNTIYHWWK